MKKLLTSLFIIVLGFAAQANAQSAGQFWIQSFSPGSSDLNGADIDNKTLALLDSLMSDETITFTFLGAADRMAWRMDGKTVHKNISETWNDAKRLSRARALRSRYGRGNVGVTHEDIAGVKVIWTKATPEQILTDRMNTLQKNNDNLQGELDDLKENLEGIQLAQASNGTNGHNGHTDVKIKKTFNWKLSGGMWGWTSGSNTMLSPSLGLSFRLGKTAFIIQGGVTPWQTSSPNGNQGQSFVYAGIKRMTSDLFGISTGVFRGWEFFTSTDTWSFTTTGLAGGVILNYKRLEFSPSLTYSHSNSIEKESNWQLGGSLGLNININ